MDSEKKISVQLSPKSSSIESFFDNNTQFAFMVKKTEKLASAVYLITNLFSDNEPMKWSLREKMSHMLSVVITYKDIPNSLFSNFKKEIEAEVFGVISMMEVSMNGGLISKMNFSIINHEFVNLLDFISSQKGDVEVESNFISRTFFDVPPPAQTRSFVREEIGTNYENPERMSFKNLKDKESRENVGNVKRSSRQTTILNLIKKKHEVTIKDISNVIKNCSEKTIQRELISFMAGGIVKRIGERRWSKYSLV